VPLPLDQLEAEAARMEREVAKLVAEGHLNSARRLAEEAVAVRAFVEARRGDTLPSSNRRGNQEAMVTAERLRHSEGTGKERDPLVKAANAAGYTLRSLGEALKVTHSFLSQARRGKPIRRDLAEQIEKLTGFKASKRNWPGLKG